MKINILIVFYLLSTTSCDAQPTFNNYIGGWSGTCEEKNPFLFDIEIIPTEDGIFANFTGKHNTTKILLKAENNNYLVGKFENQLTIRIDTTSKNPIVFVQTGHHLSNIEVSQSSSGTWKGKWNLLIEETTLPTFYLSLDKQDDGSYTASTFFKEPTYHYMLAQDFGFSGNKIEFSDLRSNIKFNGVLKNKRIDLTLHFLGEFTQIELSPKPYDQWQIGQFSQKITGDSDSTRFSQLVADIQSDTLERTHSVVISQFGEIIFEKYFDGFTSNTPHDTRSLSKSFASAMIGIAIADHKIKDEHIPIKNFYETQYPEIAWKDDKENITIQHLLTMSSGLDAIDFGQNRNSFANEGAYQNEEDWTKYILTAPMVYEPGKTANYGSGNPHLLASILSNSIDERLEFYIHKKLFRPLSISNYRIQTNNADQPYFGGGWYLTPRDLLKFGQLYLNNGFWEGKEVMPRKWVEKSFRKYGILENTVNKNEYGYLFWHRSYDVNGKTVESIEARGSGGQYLFIIPEYQLVAVITSGNYRNGKGFQPEDIMEKYILKKIVK